MSEKHRTGEPQIISYTVYVVTIEVNEATSGEGPLIGMPLGNSLQLLRAGKKALDVGVIAGDFSHPRGPA